MEQLYFTSCKSGASISGNSGFQIRAASSGLTAEHQRALLPHIGYALPPSARTDGSSPVRLALLRLPSETLLIHSVDSGTDPTTGRPGNFFSHLIVDVPNDIDVLDALSLWDSPFWQRSDDDAIDTKLPSLDSLPTNARNMYPDVRENLSSPQRQTWLAFLLSAYLGQKRKLFIVSEPPIFVSLLMSLSVAIPRSMRRKMSFSTYDPNPQSSSASIVGAVRPISSSADLPELCYIGSNACLNTISGRMSSDVDILSYATFAAQTIAKRGFYKLSEIAAICDEIDLTDGRLIDLVEPALIRDGFSHQIGKQNVYRVLSHRNLATAWLGQPNVAEYVAELCVADHTFLRECIDEIGAISAAEPSIREVIAETVEKLATQLLRTDPDKSLLAWEEIVPKVDPQRGETLWPRLLEKFAATRGVDSTVTQVIPLFVRLRLISRWGSDPVTTHNANLVAVARSWLKVQGVDIADVIHSSIDPEFKIYAACEVLSGQSSMPQAAIRALIEDPQLLRGTLLRLSSVECGDKALRQLLAQGKPQAIQVAFNELAANPSSGSSVMAEALLDVLTRYRGEDRNLEILVISLMSSDGGILQQLSNSALLGRAIDKVIASWDVRVLKDKARIIVLERISTMDTVPRSSETVQRLNAFVTIDRFHKLDKATKRDALDFLKAGTLVDFAVDKRSWGELEPLLLSAVKDQSDIEHTLLEVGRIDLGYTVRLCYGLGEDLRRGRSAFDMDAVESLLKICLGGANDRELRASLNSISAELRRFAVGLTRQLTNDQYTELVDRSRNWSKPALQAWTDLGTGRRKTSVIPRMFRMFRGSK